MIDEFRDTRCAPSKTYQDGSCIPLDILTEMANAYNRTSSKQKIYVPTNVDNAQKKQIILKQFEQVFKDCNDQMCWLKKPFVAYLNKETYTDLKNFTFRPSGPEGRFEWLSTIDINKTMRQYEQKYSNFKFLGTVPIDFDNLPEVGFNNLNFEELQKNGKTKIGAVFNLDEHYKSGSHWVALFADLEKSQIYFSDSYGIKPHNNIQKFIDRIDGHLKKKYTNIDKRINRTRHQYEGSECGVYSINFILRLLRGDSFEDITKQRIKDRTINKCRMKYFNNTKF